MSFAAIAGHERPLRVLRRAVRADRVPHAYLFWGPEGVGKETVARELARVLLCADPGALVRAEACGACPACRKVAAGTHADLHLVVAKGASLPVAEVRTLQETLAYQAFERGRKVVILRDSFRLTREAGNALLKTLEEPVAGVHIVLLAQHRNQLLPTLVSRCQSLRFDPLPVADVGRLLRAQGVAAEAADALAAVSGGCPGTVVGEEPEAVLAREAEAREVWSRWGERRVAEGFALTSRWAGEKDRLGGRLDALEVLLRRRALEAAQAGGWDDGTLDALERLARARRLLDQNVNTQLALDTLFLGVAGRDREETL